MHNFHRLLLQQLKSLGLDPMQHSLSPDELQKLLDIISHTYQKAEQVQELLEQTEKASSHELKRIEHELRYTTTHDDLTNLANRRMFMNRLEQALNRAQRNKSSLATIFIDIDRFKNVNESLGHDMGDVLLLEISQRLRLCLRRTDFIARWGGDEFIVLVEDVSDPKNLAILSKKILKILGNVFFLKDHEIHISASIGISIYPNDGETAVLLLKKADTAMHQVKIKGKNNFEFYSSSMDSKILKELTLESELHRALKNNEFFLCFQPRINIQNNTITGVEALIRWNHPQQGIIFPGNFISLAEETGLIIPIGIWVLKTACQKLIGWGKDSPLNLNIAINLSARQFDNPILLQEIIKTIANTGVNPQHLEFELTESTIMQNPEHGMSILKKLKELGVKMAIDDFGTGYSSLSYLQQFPINRLKIDRSFIHQLTINPDAKYIVDAIIAMASSLKLLVVAEGVELKEELNYLNEKNCDEVQGYYFSKPLAEIDLLEFLKTWPKQLRSL